MLDKRLQGFKPLPGFHGIGILRRLIRRLCAGCEKLLLLHIHTKPHQNKTTPDPYRAPHDRP